MWPRDYITPEERLEHICDVRQGDMGTNLFVLVVTVAWIVYLVMGG